jgi:citrate lyase beta subunit
MKQFSYLTDDRLNQLFYKLPENIDFSSDVKTMGLSLGGTLYMPATKKDVPEIFRARRFPALSSVVFCLEDSIANSDYEDAKKMLALSLQRVNHYIEEGEINPQELPLFFIRVKELDVFQMFQENPHLLRCICGFVLPKADANIIESLMCEIQKLEAFLKRRVYFMPILESKELIYKESRYRELESLLTVLKPLKENVLNIRIGATDLCSIFSLRRKFTSSIYDVAVVNDFISDVLNYFRRSELDFTISGSVWEYYSNNFFNNDYTTVNFSKISSKSIEFSNDFFTDPIFTGLIKEIKLDIDNGIVGKTVIHPGHVIIVNSNLAVLKEDYEDAIAITHQPDGGAISSSMKNRMNEPKPHFSWAKNILLRSKAYGVLNDNYDYKSIIGA